MYVWIGSKADPDEARLIEEIAEEMFNNVSINSNSVSNGVYMANSHQFFSHFFLEESCGIINWYSEGL